MNKEISIQNITLDNGRKLLVSHSSKRARKDKADREKGIEKLRTKLAKEKSVKSQLSNQGYKKYLSLESNTKNRLCDLTRVRAHLAISFAALFLVRHLEHRVRVRYKKLSPQYIRKLLLNTQTSILYSKAKKIKYAIPSQMKAETIKIYRLMNVKRDRTPYIIEKF